MLVTSWGASQGSNADLAELKELQGAYLANVRAKLKEIVSILNLWCICKVECICQGCTTLAEWQTKTPGADLRAMTEDKDALMEIELKVCRKLFESRAMVGTKCITAFYAVTARPGSAKRGRKGRMRGADLLPR